MCDAVAQLQPTLSSRIRRADEELEIEYRSRRGDATTHPTEEELLASGTVHRYLETAEGRRLYQIYLAKTSPDDTSASTNFASTTTTSASANSASDSATSAFDSATSASAN